MAYLLDTNIIIAAMNGVPEVRLRLESTPLSQIILSVIVLGELEVGAEKSQQTTRNRSRLEEIKKNIPLVTLSEKTCRIYGQIRGTLEKQGSKIGANDFWIAAQTLTEEAVLVTDNIREFSRVPGLRIENWISRS
jgi:tRNA(fMet)-specific endonuclease VapC